YLGMANDIAEPLLLFPRIKKIYAISLFDPVYSREGTWESQKADIMHMITTGERFLKDNVIGKYLPHRGVILRNADDVRRKCWRLKFRYNGAVRKLIYYYDRNFKIAWPREIKKLDYLIFTASCWVRSINKRTPSWDIFRNMIQRRCNDKFTVYTLLWDFKHISEMPYDGRITLTDGRDGGGEDEKTKLGYVTLRKKDLLI